MFVVLTLGRAKRSALLADAGKDVVRAHRPICVLIARVDSRIERVNALTLRRTSEAPLILAHCTGGRRVNWRRACARAGAPRRDHAKR